MAASLKSLLIFAVCVCWAFCPDKFTACLAIDTSGWSCNRELIQQACPTTCESGAIRCPDKCNLWILTGYVAFLFYGVMLFLLVVILTLIYTFFFNPEPPQKSIRRISRRNPDYWKKSRSEINFSRIRKNVPGSEEKHDNRWSLVSYSNHNSKNPNNNVLPGLPSSVTDPISDIMGDDWDENDMEAKRFSYEQKIECPKHNSNHTMVCLLQKDGKRNIQQLNIRENIEWEAGDFDSEDEFFKYALVDKNDSFLEDFEPPPPPRVGGPRKPQALSKKLEATKKMVVASPWKFNKPEGDVILPEIKNRKISGKKSRVWSLELSSRFRKKSYGNSRVMQSDKSGNGLPMAPSVVKIQIERKTKEKLSGDGTVRESAVKISRIEQISKTTIDDKIDITLISNNGKIIATHKPAEYNRNEDTCDTLSNSLSEIHGNHVSPLIDSGHSECKNNEFRVKPPSYKPPDTLKVITHHTGPLYQSISRDAEEVGDYCGLQPGI